MKIKNIWYEFEEWSEEVDQEDCNADVIFELQDGSKWCASFYTFQNLLSLSRKNSITGECLSGTYFYVDKPIFISKMDKTIILSVIKDALQNDLLSYMFTKVNA